MTNYEIHIIENTATKNVYVKYHKTDRADEKSLNLRGTYKWAVNELAKGSTKDYVQFVGNSDYYDLQLTIKPVAGDNAKSAREEKIKIMNEIENLGRGLKVVNPQRK